MRKHRAGRTPGSRDGNKSFGKKHANEQCGRLSFAQAEDQNAR